jgi:hypothetical protein
VSPSKNRNSSSFTEDRRGNHHHNKNLQGVTYPVFPSLRNIAGAPGEKNSNPKYRGIRD